MEHVPDSNTGRTVSSSKVHARLGSLYDKYTDEAYWYELVSCALWHACC